MEIDSRVDDPERWAAYEDAGDPAAPDRDMVELARHISAMRDLSERGEERLARGAMNVATITALRLTTIPCSSEQAHERKLDVVERVVDLLDGAARAHIVALVEAALWTDAVRRNDVGVPPYRRGLRVRRSATGSTALGDPVVTPGRLGIRSDELRRYGMAIAATDPDFALATAIGVLRDLTGLPRNGRTAEGAWTILSNVALGLCINPADSMAARLDVRRPLTILWQTLRRRRPSSAAIIRRRLALDRKQWPGRMD